MIRKTLRFLGPNSSIGPAVAGAIFGVVLLVFGAPILILIGSGLISWFRFWAGVL